MRLNLRLFLSSETCFHWNTVLIDGTCVFARVVYVSFSPIVLLAICCCLHNSILAPLWEKLWAYISTWTCKGVMWRLFLFILFYFYFYCSWLLPFCSTSKNSLVSVLVLYFYFALEAASSGFLKLVVQKTAGVFVVHLEEIMISGAYEIKR